MERWVQKASPLVSAWSRLTPVQKAVLTMVGLLSVIALAVSISMASRPQYSVLFSNLSASDANAIVEKLKDSKVDYRLSAGGAAVEVPAKDVYDLRLQLAGAGLPQGGNVGFEIFDKSSFGMTEFTQKLDYQRALQGELARTIGQLAPVAQARVHLAIPEQSLYSDKAEETSASVVIKLKPGGQLAQDQVIAVTHLVAAAVEGLKPENVAVVDTDGNLLSDGSSGSLSASGLRLSVSQLQMQKQYETQVARDLQVMLEKVLGPGKAVVRVNARMNFDSKQTDSEVYEPIKDEKGVLVSQDQLRENYSGAPKGMPGAPALAGAVGGPAGAVTRTTATGDTYTRTQDNVRYAVTKRVEHTTQSPGKIERLSVGVLLDGTVTPAISTAIRQTIAAAVGIDPTRGDQVTVDSLPFDNSAATNEQKEMEKADRRDIMMSFGKWGAAVLLGLLFLLFLRSFLFRWRPIEIVESYPQPLPLHAAEAEAEAAAGGQVELRSHEPARPPRIAARRPSEVAQGREEDVAQLVRTWLTEE